MTVLNKWTQLNGSKFHWMFMSEDFEIELYTKASYFWYAKDVINKEEIFIGDVTNLNGQEAQAETLKKFSERASVLRDYYDTMVNTITDYNNSKR